MTKRKMCEKKKTAVQNEKNKKKQVRRMQNQGCRKLWSMEYKKLKTFRNFMER